MLLKKLFVVDTIVDHCGIFRSSAFTNCSLQTSFMNKNQLRCFNNKIVKKFLSQVQNILWEETYVGNDPDHGFSNLLLKIESCFYEFFFYISIKKRYKLYS